MSTSFTTSGTTSFTLTHAKHIAAKVATDLKRVQRFYGSPSDESISCYESEIIELLKNGYLDRVTYGFKRGETWIEPTLRYTAQELSSDQSADDDPGKVRPNADISGASFYSFLTYSEAWHRLSSTEQSNFKQSVPVQRGFADEPGVNGYFASDKVYASGGRALNRSIVKRL